MMMNLSVYFLTLVVLANGIHGYELGPPPTDQVCIPGKTFMQECNICTCSLHGTSMVCTRMACRKTLNEHLNADDYPKLLRQDNPLLRAKRDLVCQPNTSRKINDHVTCLCVSDGMSENCKEIV